MTDWREELIEKMARALAQSHVNGLVYQDAARAALAVAEPVIREQCEQIRHQQEVEALREENARLREALKGVIRIADRNTIEFDIARAAIREGGEDRYARG